MKINDFLVQKGRVKIPRTICSVTELRSLEDEGRSAILNPQLASAHRLPTILLFHTLVWGTLVPSSSTQFLRCLFVCTGSCYVAEEDLELLILLPSPFRCCEPLRMELRMLCTPSKQLRSVPTYLLLCLPVWACPCLYLSVLPEISLTVYLFWQSPMQLFTQPLTCLAIFL